MTLICSSCCSDSVTVSRDVTLPQHPKRLLRALILSCLILCPISYDKQMRRVVVAGRDAHCFAAGSRCVCEIGSWATLDWKTWLQIWDSSVLSLHWMWLIGSEPFQPLPCHLCLFDSENKSDERKPLDVSDLLWTIRLLTELIIIIMSTGHKLEEQVCPPFLHLTSVDK